MIVNLGELVGKPFKSASVELKRGLEKLEEAQHSRKKVFSVCSISCPSCKMMFQAKLEVSGVKSYMEALCGAEKGLERVKKTRPYKGPG